MPQERIPLEEMTIRQLREEAARYQIPKYSRMTKDQLIQAVREAQAKAGRPADTMPEPSGQEAVTGTKFVGPGRSNPDLVDVDKPLGDLPDGYGESRTLSRRTNTKEEAIEELLP